MRLLKRLFTKKSDLEILEDKIINDPELNSALETHKEILYRLTKRLIVYRYMNSSLPAIHNLVNEVKKKIFKGKNELNEEDMSVLVELQLQSISEMDRLKFAEATIATICDSYFLILRQFPSDDVLSIFKKLDRSRGSNHLRNFGDQKLDIANYIIHTLHNENPGHTHKFESTELMKEQIELALLHVNDFYPDDSC